MVLQANGVITLSNIKAEFGGGIPMFMTNYYSGGANVQTGLAGIPTTGLITLSQFYGKAKVVAVLYTFTTFTFNTLSTGFSTTGQPLTTFQANATYNTQTWFASYFSLHNNINGYQKWTIPATKSYSITAAGAKGGNAAQRTGIGGAGAQITGTFSLTQGNWLIILCGQYGQDGTTDQCGGGGGSFVVLYDGTTYTPLVVAGGGGGADKAGNGVASSTVSPYGTTAAGANTALNGGLGYNSFLTPLNGMSATIAGGFGGGGAALTASRGCGGGGFVGGAGAAVNYTGGSGGTSYIATGLSYYVSSSAVSTNASANGFVTITAL